LTKHFDFKSFDLAKLDLTQLSDESMQLDLYSIAWRQWWAFSGYNDFLNLVSIPCSGVLAYPAANGCSSLMHG